jgi:hypothetical protein
MPKSPKNPVADTSAGKAIRCAIRKTDTTHERPIVGKPIIVEPVDEKARERTKRSQRRAADLKEWRGVHEVRSVLTTARDLEPWYRITRQHLSNKGSRRPGLSSHHPTERKN